MGRTPGPFLMAITPIVAKLSTTGQLSRSGGLHRFRRISVPVYTEQLEAVAKKHCDVNRLMSAPGIGLVRAATIVAVVVTPHRFRTTRQFWAYCGLAVVTHATSEWSKAPKGQMRRRKEVVRTRGLNPNRHPWLKSVFKGAAHTVITQMPEHPLAMHYRLMVEAGTNPSLAWLTIRRRIAAAVLSMGKKEQEYDASQQEPKKTAA